MKRISLIAIALLAAATFSANAQGMEDALRYSQPFYVGSARTMAMGNAFTALGGDLGAVGINPASTALYNCCEFAITGGFSWDKNNALFETTEGNFTSTGKRTVFTVPNISMVFSLPTGRDAGLVSYSFGFGYNKIANFNTRVSYRGDDGESSLLGKIAAGLEGVDNSYLMADDAYEVGYCTNQEILAYDTYLVNPYHQLSDSYIGATENEWLGGGLGVDNILDKDYDRIVKGGIYDMSFNFGLNFSDRLYLGVNANINMVDYKDDVFYSENGDISGNYFDSGFKSMSYNYIQETSGAGVNLQFGAIWVPFNFLRLGATYTTPTSYELTDRWRETMYSSFDGSTSYKSADSESPVMSYQYRVTAPSRYSLGAALVFGRAGLLSFDYEGADYGKTRIDDHDYDFKVFQQVNEDLESYCGKSNIIRIGAELNLPKDFSIRSGYSRHMFKYHDPEERYYTKYLSFGFGKRLSENSTIDVAFRKRLKETYTTAPYDDYAFNDAGVAQCLAPLAEINNKAYDLMLTYKVKF